MVDPLPLDTKTSPLPVVVANQDVPVPVVVTSDERLFDSVPATSTAEEDRHSAGQRSINRKWESVQAIIAVEVTTAACIVAIYLIIKGEYALGIGLISNMVGLVIGFYFSRTNHEKVGGVQLLPPQKNLYTGR